MNSQVGVSAGGNQGPLKTIRARQTNKATDGPHFQQAAEGIAQHKDPAILDA